jgi:chromosome segregation ATPase
MEELKKAIETATATVNERNEAVKTATEKVNASREAVANAEMAMFENPGKSAVEKFKKAKEELANAETELATAETELANAETELANAEKALEKALPNAVRQLRNVIDTLSVKQLVKYVMHSDHTNRGAAIAVALVLKAPEKYLTPSCWTALKKDMREFMDTYAPTEGMAPSGNMNNNETYKGAIALAYLLAGYEPISEEQFNNALAKGH